MVQEITSVGCGLMSGSMGKPILPQRAGSLLVGELIDLYMSHYEGRDPTRVQRLGLWKKRVGHLEVQALCDNDIHAVLEALAQQRSRVFAGKDIDGMPIYKPKRKSIAPATVNRYAASLAAVITWAIKRRIAPKGYVHPCRSVEREPENNEKTRFLSDDERERLLTACKASPWPRLYVLVLMALTTGARKGELLGLTWADLDEERGLALVGRSKNGDPKLLPIVPAVRDELARFKSAPANRLFRRCDIRKSHTRSKCAGNRLCTLHGFEIFAFTTCGIPVRRCWRRAARRCSKSPTCSAIGSCR